MLTFKKPDRRRYRVFRRWLTRLKSHPDSTDYLAWRHQFLQKLLFACSLSNLVHIIFTFFSLPETPNSLLFLIIAILVPVHWRVVLQKLFKDRAFLSISSRSRSNSENLRHRLRVCLLFRFPVFVLFESCSLPHILLMNARAVLNEPKPIPGLISRLINRWSCSTILLRYLTLRSSVVSVRVRSALSLSIAGGRAAFLSTFITRGDWL